VNASGVTLAKADLPRRSPACAGPRLISFLKLFVNYLDLLIDYLPGESVYGHMDPVVDLTLDYKIRKRVCGIWA